MSRERQLVDYSVHFLSESETSANEMIPTFRYLSLSLSPAKPPKDTFRDVSIMLLNPVKLTMEINSTGSESEYVFVKEEICKSILTAQQIPRFLFSKIYIRLFIPALLF